MFFLDDESGITSKSNNEDICTESDINCFMDDNDKLFEYISKAKSNSQNFIANVQRIIDLTTEEKTFILPILQSEI